MKLNDGVVALRVIAGHLKGRRFKSVPGKDTRPTADKVKEAVFQMIGPFFDSGYCLDLFAGSGSLGIEAISRGMTHAVFVDKQGQAVKTIKTNIKTLNIDNQTEVLKMDATRALQVLAKNNASFNLVLIDPPYQLVDYDKILEQIITHNLLKENGIVICEHDRSEKLELIHKNLTIIKQADYGTTAITIYRYTKGGVHHG